MFTNYDHVYDIAMHSQKKDYLIYLKNDFVIMLSIKSADGSILFMPHPSYIFSAIQEVNGDTGGKGEDPCGADSNGCVKLSSEWDAFHRVHNSLQEINI